MMVRVEWHPEKLIGAVRAASDEAAGEIARLVMTDARGRCPVVTGLLRSTIRVEKSQYEGGGWLVQVGSREAYYATWVELGAPSRGGKARPFMKPALHKNAKRFKAEVEKRLK